MLMGWGGMDVCSPLPFDGRPGLATALAYSIGNAVLTLSVGLLSPSHHTLRRTVRRSLRRKRDVTTHFRPQRELFFENTVACSLPIAIART